MRRLKIWASIPEILIILDHKRDMKYQADIQEKFVVITLLEDKLDSRISPKLKSEFLVHNAEGVRNMILDLSQVQYADSSGLSAILIGHRLCQNNKGIMILTGVQEQVEKLITISRLDEVLNILPTQQEAVEAVFLNELEGDFIDEDDTVDEEFLEDEIDDLDEVEDWEEDKSEFDEREDY
jgi:anti-anti-sigma factor